MFTYLYLILGWLLYLAAIPVLLILALFPKYRQSVPARFFLKNNPPFAKEGIWFHACSLGEVNSLNPIVSQLSVPVNLSVITQTGYGAAGALDVDRRYLPFEIFLPFWVRRQKALVVLEAELWYMLFVSAKRKGMKTYLLNARISDRSWPRYRRFGWFYRRLFVYVDMVYAQSEKDKRRLEALGAKHVEVLGNIKSYTSVAITRTFPKPSGEVVVLASTHADEEAMLLEQLQTEGRTIIVVPRHPERFEKVASLCKIFAAQKGLSFSRFSKSGTLDADLVLMDRMGELVNLYAIADVVILGGSFVTGVGGHNPLEAAHFHTRLVSGRHIFNQEALFPLVENVVFCEAEEIEEAIAMAKPTSSRGEADLARLIGELSHVV